MKKVFSLMLLVLILLPSITFAAYQQLYISSTTTAGVQNASRAIDTDMNSFATIPVGNDLDINFGRIIRKGSKFTIDYKIKKISDGSFKYMYFQLLDETGVAKQSIQVNEAVGQIVTGTKISQVINSPIKTLRLNVSVNLSPHEIYDIKVTIDEPILPKPTLFGLVGNGFVNLFWSEIPDATGYNVYKNGVKITSTPITSTNYTATGLTNGTTYSFQVSAVDIAGESLKSETITLIPDEPPPDPPDPIAPSAPTGLTGTGGNKQVTLSWTGVDNATGYNVYRNATKITETPVAETTHVVSGLADGTSYIFAVTAVNDVGESSKSSSVTIKTADEEFIPPENVDLSYVAEQIYRTNQRLVSIMNSLIWIGGTLSAILGTTVISAFWQGWRSSK